MPPAKTPLGVDTYFVWLLDDGIWHSVPVVRPTVLPQLYYPARPDVRNSSHSCLEAESNANQGTYVR